MRALQLPFVLPEVNKLLVAKLKVTLSTDQFSEICQCTAGFQLDDISPVCLPGSEDTYQGYLVEDHMWCMDHFS